MKVKPREEKKVLMEMSKLIKKGALSKQETLIKNSYGKNGLLEYLVAELFVVDDAELAWDYYQKSSDEGHPMGHFKVALSYLNGEYGQLKNEEMAVKMMKKSVKGGHGPALFMQGRWILQEIMGFQKDAKKANMWLHKALKDPVLELSPYHHAATLVALAQIRSSGSGCIRNPSVALKHYQAAEEIDPDQIDQKFMKHLKYLVAFSGVEIQREADTRNRRWHHMVKNVQNQSLEDWITLYKHCGMDLDVEPSEEEAEMFLPLQGMEEWMEKVGARSSLPEEYPAMNDTPPPLECEKPGCKVTEETIKKQMQKCTECQIPYCGADCLRADWQRHRSVCEVVSCNIVESSYSSEELLKVKRGQTEELAGMLEKMGLSMGEFDTMVDFTKEQESKGVDHIFNSLEKERKGKNVTQANTRDEAPSSSSDENTNLAAEAASQGVVGKNESKPLKRLLAALEKNPGQIYCLFTPDNDGDYDRCMTLDHIKATSGPYSALLFGSIWSELISLPWGSPGAAGSKCLWQIYELLQAGMGRAKFKDMIRAQMTAEFGGDPQEWKLNNEYNN